MAAKAGALFSSPTAPHERPGTSPKSGRSPGLLEADRLAKVFLPGVSGAVYAPCIVQGKCRVERRGFEGLEF